VQPTEQKMEAKILKTIRLGKQRVLTIDSDYDVFIRDEVNSEKKALFTGRRFVKFMLTMEDLNRVVGKARDGKKVHVKEHLGGGWYMSLTPGVACIDGNRLHIANLYASENILSLS